MLVHVSGWFLIRLNYSRLRSCRVTTMADWRSSMRNRPRHPTRQQLVPRGEACEIRRLLMGPPFWRKVWLRVVLSNCRLLTMRTMRKPWNLVPWYRPRYPGLLSQTCWRVVARGAVVEVLHFPPHPPVVVVDSVVCVPGGRLIVPSSSVDLKHHSSPRRSQYVCSDDDDGGRSQLSLPNEQPIRIPRSNDPRHSPLREEGRLSKEVASRRR